MTGEIMNDFPLNPSKWSQMLPHIREHALFLLRQQGYFSQNGTDEDFKLFCKQVEINSQTLAKEKEEKHKDWILKNPATWQEQEQRKANLRGRGGRNTGYRGGWRGNYNNTGGRNPNYQQQQFPNYQQQQPNYQNQPPNYQHQQTQNPRPPTFIDNRPGVTSVQRTSTNSGVEIIQLPDKGGGITEAQTL